MAKYIRADHREGKTYYWLVSCRREGKKVIQKRLCYLGKVRPTLEDALRLHEKPQNKREGGIKAD